MNKYVYLAGMIGFGTLFVTTGPSYGKGMLFGYNLGVSYSSATNYAMISYETPSQGSNLPEDCDTSNVSQAGHMRCSAYLSPDTSDSSSFSAYIEKPFERQGFFYLSPGFSLSTVSYTGSLNSKPNAPLKTSSSTTKTTATKQNAQQAATAPLDHAYINMYGINWQARLKFGITPHYFPDLLASVGVGIQTVAGSVKVFETKATSYIIQPDGFAELEAVIIRAHSGYISLFGALDQSLATPIGTNLIKDNPSNTQTTNYRLGLQHQELGCRVLLPF